MASATDLTFAEHPDEFTQHRSVVGTTICIVIGVLCIGAAALALLNYEEIRTNALEYTGRRWWLRGLTAPAAVGFSLFAAALSLYLATIMTSWRRVGTGKKMKGFGTLLDGTVETGALIHQRLSTGDPAQYLPLPIRQKGKIGLTVVFARDERLAFVVLSHGSGKNMTRWPLITLSGRACDEMWRVKTQIEKQSQKK